MKNKLVSSNRIYFGAEVYTELQTFLHAKKSSSIFILVDKNTEKFCLPYFLKRLETKIPIKTISIHAGEEHKTLETCTAVWNALSESGADRKSLLLNLGGGMVTDLGGFVATTFLRGIDFVHIPTSLLGMVDASIGGKNGVDLRHLKNQIGSFHLPELILIDPRFLKTLPERELKSGIAEMWKHSLIHDREYWNRLKKCIVLDLGELEGLIKESVQIKTQIVSQDLKEGGLRKILNFGHTLGHAVESYFLASSEKPTLLHGEAIAIGIILESFISSELKNFPKEDLQEISHTILSVFEKPNLKKSDVAPIIELLKHDKKNLKGKINFVLLRDIGQPEIDCEVSNELILNSFTYYTEIKN